MAGRGKETPRPKIRIVTMPTLSLLERVIHAFNEDLEQGAVEHLARNRPIPIGEAEIWLHRYRKGQQLVAIALEGDNVAGAGHISMLHGRKSHNGIISVTVFERYRRKGIGEALFRNLINQAKARGITRIESEPIETNQAAISLEKKLGFVVEGIQKRKFRTDNGDYVSCLYMVLYLEPDNRN